MDSFHLDGLTQTKVSKGKSNKSSGSASGKRSISLPLSQNPIQLMEHVVSDISFGPSTSSVQSACPVEPTQTLSSDLTLESFKTMQAQMLSTMSVVSGSLDKLTNLMATGMRPHKATLYDSSSNEEPPAKKPALAAQGLDLNALLSSSDESNYDINGSKQPESPQTALTEKADFLTELTSDFKFGDKPGPPVADKVAVLFNAILESNMPEDKYGELLKKYSKPENCNGLEAVKVNTEIWAGFDKSVRSRDLILQHVQLALTKSMSAILPLLNRLVSNKGPDCESERKLNIRRATDALAILAHSNMDLNFRRREQLKPFLNSYYRALCTRAIPVTNWLFGDELSKNIRDINETNRVGKTVPKRDQRYFNKDRQSFLYRQKVKRSGQFPNKRFNRGSQRDRSMKSNKRDTPT